MATILNGSDNFNTNNVATQTELDAQPSPLGVGQTLQNVTSSRAHNVTYTNSTGRAIMVFAVGWASSYSYITVFIDGNRLLNFQSRDTATATSRASCMFLVPAGSTYSINFASYSGSGSFDSWWELR